MHGIWCIWAMCTGRLKIVYVFHLTIRNSGRVNLNNKISDKLSNYPSWSCVVRSSVLTLGLLSRRGWWVASTDWVVHPGSCPFSALLDQGSHLLLHADATLSIKIHWSWILKRHTMLGVYVFTLQTLLSLVRTYCKSSKANYFNSRYTCIFYFTDTSTQQYQLGIDITYYFEKKTWHCFGDKVLKLDLI